MISSIKSVIGNVGMISILLAVLLVEGSIVFQAKSGQEVAGFTSVTQMQTQRALTCYASCEPSLGPSDKYRLCRAKIGVVDQLNFCATKCKTRQKGLFTNRRNYFTVCMDMDTKSEKAFAEQLEEQAIELAAFKWFYKLPEEEQQTVKAEAPDHGEFKIVAAHKTKNKVLSQRCNFSQEWCRPQEIENALRDYGTVEAALEILKILDRISNLVEEDKQVVLMKDDDNELVKLQGERWVTAFFLTDKSKSINYWCFKTSESGTFYQMMKDIKGLDKVLWQKIVQEFA